MAQNPPQLCPRCGATAEAGQRFCAECGAALSSEGNKPTELASGDSLLPGVPQGGANVLQPTVPAAPPALASYDPTVLAPRANNAQPPASSPAPVPTLGAQSYQAGTEPDVIAPPPPTDSYMAIPQSMPSQSPAPAQNPTQAPGNYLVPEYARVPRRSRGCLIFSILLLLALIAGAGIYFGFIR